MPAIAVRCDAWRRAFLAFATADERAAAASELRGLQRLLRLYGQQRGGQAADGADHMGASLAGLICALEGARQPVADPPGEEAAPVDTFHRAWVEFIAWQGWQERVIVPQRRRIQNARNAALLRRGAGLTPEALAARVRARDLNQHPKLEGFFQALAAEYGCSVSTVQKRWAKVRANELVSRASRLEKRGLE